MKKRNIESLLLEYGSQFRSVAVVGPRQSGKTTLVKKVFKNKPYVSLENPDELILANSDPREFLNRFPNGAILDEVQKAPEIFNYLQEILDNTSEDGLFILTGSNNFLIQEKISQSLAGRIGYLDLYPLTIDEIQQFDWKHTQLTSAIVKGSYPEIFDKNRKSNMWYASYIRTYMERDVRQIKNITNQLIFNKFLKLCAGRIGQSLNINAISNEVGIDAKTVQSWLSILEASYIIKLIPPFYKNFNKRITKSPKLYFIDTGLACNLLNITSENEVEYSHFKGALVENFITIEIIKQDINKGGNSKFYFWKENNGVEVDLIIENENGLMPIEIKSSSTFNYDFIKNLIKFRKYSGVGKGVLLYNGKQEMTLKEFEILNWNRIPVGLLK